MPRSKRNKVVHLTKTAKKDREWKGGLIDDIRQCVDEYKNVYVFSWDNMRTNRLKLLRNELSTSRFFLGRNKVAQVAFGRTPEDEYKENLGALSTEVTGERGLLFTDLNPKDVRKAFAAATSDDYARSGFVATETVEVPAGPMPQFLHSMEPGLRKLGLPTKLNVGVIELIQDYTVCTKGETLSPEQCRMLKLFEKKMATFSLQLVCRWHDDTFEDYSE